MLYLRKLIIRERTWCFTKRTVRKVGLVLDVEKKGSKSGSGSGEGMMREEAKREEGLRVLLVLRRRIGTWCKIRGWGTGAGC